MAPVYPAATHPNATPPVCQRRTHWPPLAFPAIAQNNGPMQPTPTELQRLIDNLIRIGTVTAVRSGECRVKTGDLITNWRPYATARAGKNRTRHRLSIGEQVLMLSVSGDPRNAYIVGPINCAAFPEPLADDDNRISTAPNTAMAPSSNTTRPPGRSTPAASRPPPSRPPSLSS